MRISALAAVFLMAAPAAHAVPIDWADWTSSTGGAPFTALGTITTDTATVGVTYTNPNGVLDLYQGAVDYWANTRLRDPATSPYTSLPNAAIGSPGVDNIPDGTDIIRLRYAGTQTLTFSEAIANPIFAFVSLNGNGYAFDQDFELLSFAGGNVDGNGVDDNGYWGGSSTTQKQVVEVSPGVFEYRLISTSGEPHGALRFTGAFDEVTWRSLNAENWNGFTVGIEGTADEVFGTVPLPASLWFLGMGAVALAGAARRRAS